MGSNDFKGRPLLSKPVSRGADNPENAQVVAAVMLVDADGKPISLSGGGGGFVVKPTYTAAEVGALAVDGVASDSSKLGGQLPAAYAATAALAGKADLVDGVVPSYQLPSYVDDVLEFTSLASFPLTGESGKVYVAKDANMVYRWSGTLYVAIGDQLALGETSATAYRGDRGKAAYDHSQLGGNAHGATPADIGAAPSVHTHGVSSISDATEVGRNLIKVAVPGATVYLQVNPDGTISSISASDLKTAIGAGGSTLALGETASDAYRGDRGKTAYDHTSLTGNTHGATPADIGALASGATAVNAAKLGNVLPSGYVLTGDARLSDSRSANDVYTWAKAISKPAYTYTEVGACSNIDARLTDSRTASDVYAWAKAAVKPTYTYMEVGACSTGDARLSDARSANDVYSWAKAAVKPTYTNAEVGALAAGGTAVDSAKLGGTLAASYATQAWVSGLGYITGITGPMVTTALGFTPLAASAQSVDSAKLGGQLPAYYAQASSLSAKADLVGGLVPANQLPSYVDDVLEFANLAAFPATGEASKVYMAVDTNLIFRWSGSVYVAIGDQLALGETVATAYRGDRGKAAYDHSLVGGNAHGATPADIGAQPVSGSLSSLAGLNFATVSFVKMTATGAFTLDPVVLGSAAIHPATDFVASAPSSATGVSFGPGDGVTIGFQLDRRVSSVLAVYKSDWQLQQLLYPTARTNVVRYNCSFANGVWVTTRCLVTSDATLAPDGSLTADALLETATALTHCTEIYPSVDTSGPITQQICIKDCGRGSATLSVYSYPGSVRRAQVTVDLTTGVVSAASVSGGASAQSYETVNLGNGWWKITQIVTLGGSEAQVYFRVYAGDGVTSYLGDVTKGIYLWGADLKVGSCASSIIAHTANVPVTVTDYAVSAASYVTFSSAPAMAAGLTADVAYYSGVFGGKVFNDTTKGILGIPDIGVIPPLSASGVSFGPGDGVTTGWQLDARVSSVSQVYREDWQGKYPLYPQAITNPITYPETFDNGSWVKGSYATISADAIAAPNGTFTADKWVESSAAGAQHYIYHQYVIPVAGTYCLSVHAKDNGRRYFVVYPQTSSQGYAIFDLVAGVVVATGGYQFVKASIKALANGWYRCAVAITTNAQSMNTLFCMTNSTTLPSPSYDGDGTSGFYMWGAQLDTGSDPMAYRSGTVTDYTLSSAFFIQFPSAPAAAAALTADVSYYPGLFDGKVFFDTARGVIGIPDIGMIPTLIATAVAFGPADGVTSSYQMDKRAAKVSAIHVTDGRGTWTANPLARQNILTKSSQFADAAWAKQTLSDGGSASVPSGFLGGRSFTATSAGGVLYRTGVPTTAGQNYTLSVWMRCAAGIQLKLGSTEGMGLPLSLTSTWTRYSLSFVAAGASTALYIGSGNTWLNGATIEVADSQFELGSSPTNYIYTDAAAVTAADYSISATFLVAFTTPPVSGAILTWDGTYYPGLFGGAFWLDTSTNRLGSTYAMGREVLTSPRTYYVRTDGSDSNNGLTNTAAGAFLTIQRAVDVVSNTLDMGSNQVVIQVGPGTYAAVTLKPCTGTLTFPVNLVGDTTTPSNVLITTSTATAAIAIVGANNLWAVKGFKVSATGSASYGAWAHQMANLYLYQMEFGACVVAHMTARQGGLINPVANYTISGNAQSHFLTISNGLIQGNALTVTLTGTPAFSSAFASTSNAGVIQTTSFVFSGTATGKRFSAVNSSIINTGGGPNYYPGDVAGTVASGSYYDTTGSVRELLQAARTYYVRKDGSDSNTGLANNSGAAFLTIQKAIDYVSTSLDMGAWQVTIQVGPGTYTEAVTLKACVGLLCPILTGDTSTPSNVVITYASGIYVVGVSSTSTNKVGWSVQGFRLSATSSCQFCLYSVYGSLIRYGFMEFATAASAHVYAGPHAEIVCYANYAIVGAAPSHLYADTHGIISVVSYTITLTGTPAFSTSFVLSYISGAVVITGCTFSGTATGKRYTASNYGVINTAGAIATYLPGDTAGVAATGLYI